MTNTSEFVQSQSNIYVSRVSIGDAFDTRDKIIKHTLDDKAITGGSPAADIIAALPEFKVGSKRRDTSLGGNDTINCYYQFNENDDIVHPINETNSATHDGMGRVYNETFDEQQQIVWLSFGLPDFANASDFMRLAYNEDLAKLMNTGEYTGVAAKIGHFLGEVLGTVVMLPFYPIKWTFKLIQKLASINTGNSAPTKYYDFKPTMALYFKCVNVILASLAVNMNLASIDEDKLAADGVPQLLKDHGLDILTILNKKFNYDKDGPGTKKHDATTDKAIAESIKDKDGNYEKSLWQNLVDGVVIGELEALMHVGFKLEKSSDSSETAQNSTKEPEISSLINGKVREGRNTTFNLAAVKNTSIGDFANTIYQGLSNVIGGAADAMGLTGGVEMMKGSGYIDIPEIYDSSSFSKSYTFDFQLRTPYGDPFSIFYSLYVPLAMLIAGAFPRSVGQNAYTSPFLVRAYCKGMFAIPMGIIDSITIKRGAAEYGWSKDMLPTQIDVSFTIKDLSPIMHVAIADGGIDDWMSILGANSSFQEYMLTLSGSDVAQRILKSQLIKNRAKALLKIASNNKFNPLMMGFSFANSTFGRAMSAFVPVSKLPGANNGVPKITN